MGTRKSNADLLDEMMNAGQAAALFEAIETQALIAAERDCYTFGAGEKSALDRRFVRAMERIAKASAAEADWFKARAVRAGEALEDRLESRKRHNAVVTGSPRP